MNEKVNVIKTGAVVTIQNCKTKELKTFQLVKFRKESNPIWTYNTKRNIERSHYNSKIVSDADGVSTVSVDTPIGKMCYGKSINDVFSCAVPNGTVAYKIIDFYNEIS